MPPHGGPTRNNRRRSRTAAFSSLGSAWHFVVRKKIIVRASLKRSPFKAIRILSRDVVPNFTSAPCNSLVADLAGRRRFYESIPGSVTRLSLVSIRHVKSCDSCDYDMAKGQRSVEPKSPEQQQQRESRWDPEMVDGILAPLVP